MKCSASLDARANCHAKCDVSGKCEAKAEVRCDGKLPTVSCEGGCKAEVEGGTFQCKGSCDVTVKGSCTAQGGVDCQGKCQGTCTGSTDAEGNCKGSCEGTCAATAPGAKCEGSFEGECSGTCTATGPSANVECNAKCTTSPGKPIKCDGKVTGGCEVDAKCNANCDASVQAKADCQVKPFEIKAQGAASANLEAAIASLQVHLPKLAVAVLGRGEAMGDVAESFRSSADVMLDPSKLGPKGFVCGALVVSTVAVGVRNVQASLEAGRPVLRLVGVGP